MSTDSDIHAGKDHMSLIGKVLSEEIQRDGLPSHGFCSRVREVGKLFLGGAAGEFFTVNHLRGDARGQLCR
jgi:hypothetical protein